MRAALAGVLSVLALAAAGCGGDDTGGAGASLAPSAAQLYVELDADLSSDQWERVQELLDRFPDRPQIEELVRDALSDENLDYERDVAPALGDTVLVIGLDVAERNAVVLTQPEDDAKFDALVRRAEPDVVVGEIDGWRAAAENQAALDALRNAGGSLSDDEAFRQAQENAPDDPLAWAFVRGDAAEDFGRGFGGQPLDVEWASGYVEAREDGPAVGFTVRSDQYDAETYESERVESAPADALAFLSFDAEAIREQRSALQPLAQILGTDLSDLFAGLRGEGAVWVRAGTGAPEVTLLLESDRPERAQAALQDLVRNLPLQVRVGVVGGQVVATTASSPAAALRPSGSLADDDDFQQATDVAGMPDETAGFLYVDVADALPLLGLAAGFGGTAVPQELIENLRPIRSVVAWSETDDGESSQTLFVHIQ